VRVTDDKNEIDRVVNSRESADELMQRARLRAHQQFAHAPDLILPAKSLELRIGEQLIRADTPYLAEYEKSKFGDW
jgi:hypothetical protein